MSVAGADVDSQVIVEHAVSMAVQVRQLQGTCVLALDAFDDDVAAIWRGRYGFWDSAPPSDRRASRRAGCGSAWTRSVDDPAFGFHALELLVGLLDEGFGARVL
jgi:hypothetical protein